MRLIGNLTTESDAKRLTDYLLTQGMPGHVEEQPSDNTWQIWIENDDHQDRAKAELQQYQVNPYDERYQASSLASRIRAEKDKQARNRRAQYVDVRTKNWSGLPQHSLPVTIVLMVISVVVFMITSGYAHVSDEILVKVFNFMLFRSYPGLTFEHWTYFDSILHGQVWRLVTPMFLHFGLLHILFNMQWLWSYGQRIEGRLGSWLFFLLVLIGSSVGDVAQILWQTASTQHIYIPFGGMSGVNYALFGFLWIFGKLRPYEHIGVTQYDWGQAIGWLVLAWAFIPNVANFAHLGGLLAGMGVAYSYHCLRKV